MRVYYVERSNLVRAISVIDPPHWFHPRSNSQRSRSNTTSTSKCITPPNCSSWLSIKRWELEDFGKDRAWIAGSQFANEPSDLLLLDNTQKIDNYRDSRIGKQIEDFYIVPVIDSRNASAWNSACAVVAE